ncbi:HIT-like domain [Pseudocohnilembus persalinus]|uniref:HIT-like domain n=1 Tax=Pseudocohnilembus persalinus TaxID=266149 RepID=A0A0V0QNX2_PSEPJ|nr:HIT-like domain [Pseudocohnilembus persalinus]|eukprot:KRX03876.1 HIT-like domain [Pseudocohnilembus persalinus]
MSQQQQTQSLLRFGKYLLPQQIMFWNKQHSYAILPLVQITPGHIILVPKKQIKSFKDLSTQELFDISLQIKFLTKYIETYFHASSSTVYMHNNDNKEEGQIEQFFVHIIPRKAGDFEINDEIYLKISEFEQQFDIKYQSYFSPGKINQSILDQYQDDAQKLSQYLSKQYKDEYIQ